MPTTPLRGWPYPAYEENPYYTTLVSTFEAQDADVNTLMTGVRSVPLGGTGAATFTAGAYLKGAGTSAITAQATPIPVADGGTGSSLGFRAACMSAGGFLQNTTTAALLDRTYTVPANAMNALGFTLRVTMSGACYTDGTPAPILDLAMNIGGTLQGTLRLQFPVMAGAGRTLTYRGSVTILTTGSTGTCACSESTAFASGIHATPISGALGVGTAPERDTALNLTTSLIVGVWAKWDIAATLNAVRVDNMLIEGIPATATFG